MKGNVILLFLVLTLTASPALAQFRGIGQYQDYKGADGGNAIFSVTGGNLEGVYLITVRFRRADAAGPDGKIIWIPSSWITHDDLVGALDDKTRVRAQGLELIPDADGKYSTEEEILRLPPGDYIIDNIEINLGHFRQVDYETKFNVDIPFQIKANQSVYVGGFSVLAIHGYVQAKTMFRSILREGVANWLCVFEDEADRDLPIAKAKATLGIINRAPILDSLPPPPAPRIPKDGPN